MPDNYLMKINDKEEVSVRLVGIIDEKDCEAILNTKDAEKKIATAESIDIKKVVSPVNRRFVVVIKDHKVKIADESEEDLKKITESSLPTLFISAVVKKISFVVQNKVLECKDKHKYQFIPIEGAA